MKNNYEVRGDVTAIFVNFRGVEYETLIDTEDFIIVNQLRGTWAMAETTSRKSFYITACIWVGKMQTSQRMHRWIMNAPDDHGLVVDHINHDALDNRKSNLRIITRGQNGQNTYGATKGNKTSGIRGVCWSVKRGKWVAYVYTTENKRRITHYLGGFDNIDEAENVVKEARKTLHPYAIEKII